MRKVELEKPKKERVLYLEDIDFGVTTTLIVAKNPNTDQVYLFKELQDATLFSFVNLGNNRSYLSFSTVTPQESIQRAIDKGYEVSALGSPNELGKWLYENCPKPKKG